MVRQITLHDGSEIDEPAGGYYWLKARGIWSTVIAHYQPAEIAQDASGLWYVMFDSEPRPSTDIARIIAGPLEPPE